MQCFNVRYVDHPPPPDPPSVTVSNAIITVNQTNSVSFSCEAFGIPPPQLQWLSSKDNSQPLQDTDVLSIQFDSFKNGSNFVLINSTLQIDSAARSDHEANFTCMGENGVDNYIMSPEFATTELIVQGTWLYRVGKPKKNILYHARDAFRSWGDGCEASGCLQKSYQMQMHSVWYWHHWSLTLFLLTSVS